ncbi:MAG: cytochrome c [Planctomycetes bacterium]|nr:cytochrome c [Planctomycetota bacterium]
MKFMRVTAFGLALAMLAAGTGLAFQGKDNKKTLEALDALAKAGNTAEAGKKAAGDLDIESVMRAFKPRAKGGFGVGAKAGLVPANQDGIEAVLPNLQKKGVAKSDEAKMAEPLTELAHRVAAIAAVTAHMGPEKDQGVKTKKKWAEFNEMMKEGAESLASAIKEKKWADVKKAAGKMNSSCSECHSVFRD